MVSETPVVVYDACVLYPFHLRNLLVELAVSRLVEAHWSDEIQKEWVDNLLLGRPALDAERLRVTTGRMNAALPSARVSGIEKHIARLVLPDAADRHVVAAAIECGASKIVTWNLRHFPPDAIRAHGLVAQDPDDFLCGTLAMRPTEMAACIARSRSHLTRSKPSIPEYALVLERQKLSRFAAALRK